MLEQTRPGVGTLVVVGWLVMVFSLVAVPGADVSPAPEVVRTADETAVLDFGDVYCDVKAESPHYSTYSNDASFHTYVACYFNSGNGAPFTVQKIKIDAKINFFDPAALSGGTICTRSGTRRNSRSWDFPTHCPDRGWGHYTGVAKVTVTARTGGESKTVTVENGAFPEEYYRYGGPAA